MAPEIVFLTTYPPQECGIATFSQDLIIAINNKFHHSFQMRVALLENRGEGDFSPKVVYGLNTTDAASYKELAVTLNEQPNVGLVVIQHEFGFYHGHEEDLISLLVSLDKPAVIVFHTVLPEPNEELRQHIESLMSCSAATVVMTEHAKYLLIEDYGGESDRITVIQHGTHLVPHTDRNELKRKYNLEGRRVLSTFGLISSGKNIEMTLEALPAIIAEHPDVIFLILGRTHPAIVEKEGETYRETLKQLTVDLGITDHVRFINRYLSLEDLLDYLQLTDTYLFTSKDPNQAVSGTFSYALSCGCPIISTPIPHATEVLSGDTGILVPFNDRGKLAQEVNRVLGDAQLWQNLHVNALHRMTQTAWENAAISYALLFQQTCAEFVRLNYSIPPAKLDHLRKLTSDFGLIQFSKLGKPDPGSGYTLDDNARALIAVCQHFDHTGDKEDLALIKRYAGFINYCLQPKGYFLNYVDEKGQFTDQNFSTNLSDSNGRAIWALGYVASMRDKLPFQLNDQVDEAFRSTLPHISGMYSTRAMAFAIKGLFYYQQANPSADCQQLISLLANRLVQMYRHEACETWEWFEGYLTYANAVIPEALLCAYEATGNITCHDIARASFDFLLSQTFYDSRIRVISNKGWYHRGEIPEVYGEQPIDIAYTIMALSRFYRCFRDEDYLSKMKTAFDWFHGHNHLHHIIYNPCTGGCWDGLEEQHVNLNQGGESTVSYLMARMTVDGHLEELRRLRRVHEARETSPGSPERVEWLRRELKHEIAEMTREIAAHYPELYRRLTDTQLFVDSFEDSTSIATLRKYVEFLRTELQQQEEAARFHQPVPVSMGLRKRSDTWRR